MSSMMEIARLCGVSVRTVSRAFSKTEYIDAGTRERILAVAEELGYAPNLAARALRTGQSYTLLAIAGTMDELHTAKMAAFERAVRNVGYSMHILFLPGNSGEDQCLDGVVESVAAQRPAGVAVFPGGEMERAALARRIEARGFSCVAIDPQGARCAGVKIDRGQGVFDAVAYLRGRGHAHMAYAGPVSDRSRLRGFERAVREFGVDATILAEESFPDQAEGGARAARQWLALPRRPTAVQTYSDEFAMGFLAALHDAGARVPTDVAVVGFDDRRFAALAWPPLSTVAQPNEEVGRAAAEVLLAKLSGEEAPRGGWSRTVPTRLVVRGTT